MKLDVMHDILPLVVLKPHQYLASHVFYSCILPIKAVNKQDIKRISMSFKQVCFRSAGMSPTGEIIASQNSQLIVDYK